MDAPFSQDRLFRLAQLERWHFWFVPRRALIRRLLGRYLRRESGPILDIGCGTGLLLEELTRERFSTVGLDLRPEGLTATKRSLPESQLVQGDATRLPFLSEGFAGVLLLDVLEHVDDRALLGEVRRVLRPGGVLLATAPAMPWLWSHRDEAAGHRRRYTRRQLEDVLRDCQLVPEEMRYYQCLLFPFLFMARVAGRRSPRPRDLEERPPSVLNTVLTGINRLETRLGDFVRWPLGSSLVAVCRRV